MKIQQVSIFLENKKGRLSDVCSVLGKSGVNIRALTVAESEDFGVLRIVVDKPEPTLKLLKENGFAAKLTPIVAVEVPDRPGGLAAVLKILTDNDINVEYMYGFVEKFGDNAMLVFRFDDPDKTVELLRKSGIKVLGNQDIAGL
jgi:hypothetical protein